MPRATFSPRPLRPALLLCLWLGQTAQAIPAIQAISSNFQQVQAIIAALEAEKVANITGLDCKDTRTNLTGTWVPQIEYKCEPKTTPAPPTPTPTPTPTKCSDNGCSKEFEGKGKCVDLSSPGYKSNILHLYQQFDLSAGSKEGLCVDDSVMPGITDQPKEDCCYCLKEKTEVWSSWGTWSACPKTCYRTYNYSYMTRRRSCIGGKSCSGKRIEHSRCNEGTCLLRTTTTTTTTPKPSMIKVFSHDTSGGLFSSRAEGLEKNPENPDAKLFSILGDLEDYRSANGSFHLKICYPELTTFDPPCNEWIQTSNPTTERTIQGFRAISLAFPMVGSGGAWVGLMMGAETLTVMHTHNYGWWMAVGCMRWYGSGTIPGPSKPQLFRVKKVEVFVEAL